MRIDVNHNVISTLVDDGKLLGRQKDELLAQYKDDMERLHKTREEGNESLSHLGLCRIKKNPKQKLD